MESIVAILVHLGHVTLGFLDQILNQFEGLLLRSGDRHTGAVKWCLILSICHLSIAFLLGYEILSDILMTVGASTV